MMQGGKDMSKEEMLLESIRNYFHVRKGLFSLDIIFENKEIIESKQIY